MLFISIPTPCHEKWDEMTPNEQGAFCKVCSKTVVDFTKLSDEEVKNYFLSRRGRQTCGRFKNDQLTGNGNELPKLLASSIPFWKKFLAIVVIVFGSFLSGCDQRTVGKMAVENSSSKTEFTTTTGIIMPEISIDPEPVDTLKMECTMTTGTPVVLMGDTTTIAEAIQFVEGEIVVESYDDPEPDSARVIVYDEDGNPIE